MRDASGQLWHDIDDNNLSEFLEQYPDAIVVSEENLDEEELIIDETLQEEALFQTALSKLIENSQIVIRGKSLLTYLLLFKMNPTWFVIAIEMDLYKNIDKLLRDNFKYV